MLQATRSRVRTLPLAFLLALGALLSTGCATVANTPKQRIEILSQPSGAHVTVAGQTLETPAFVELPRKDKELEIVVEKEGYQTATVKLTREATGKTWWNMTAIAAGLLVGAAIEGGTGLDAADGMGTGLIVGGVVALGGLAADYSNGSAYRLDPGRVVVELKPLRTSAPMPATGVR
jgi:hypothetical protein